MWVAKFARYSSVMLLSYVQRSYTKETTSRFRREAKITRRYLMVEIKLSETLTLLVNKSSYSRHEICAALSISPSALSQYLHGIAVPSLPKLVELARFFNVSLGY